MNRLFKRYTALTLVATMILLSSGRAANAMLAPANSAMESALRTQDLQTVQTFLEQKEVSDHLAGMGMTSSEVNSRLSTMNDQELHEVSTRIQHENVGRDGGGIVVTLLVIGILALLFIYLLKRV